MQFPTFNTIKSTINAYVEDEIKERTDRHNKWVINHRQYEPRTIYDFIKDVESKLKKCKEWDYYIKRSTRYSSKEQDLIKKIFNVDSITEEYTGNYKNDEYTYRFITKNGETKKLEREIEELQKQLNHKSAILKMKQ